MNKLKDFFSAHRFFFCLYPVLLIYNFLISNNGNSFLQIDSSEYTYYAVDFSMGFCTKLLPGAIYRFLVGRYSNTAVAVYTAFLLAIILLLVSVLFERFYLSVDKKYKSSALFLFALLVISPLSLNMYAKQRGMLDLYWVLFFAISLLLIKSRVGKYFIPVLIFLMVLTHYAAILCYIPALLLIILYLAVISENKSEKREYVILFAVGFVVALISTGYFLLFEQSNLTYRVDEFNKILTSRGANYRAYYDFTFYRYYPPEVMSIVKQYGITDLEKANANSGLSGALNYIIYQFRFNLLLADFKKDWYILIIAALIVAFLVYLLIKCLKSASEKSEKVVIALMLSFSPFVLSGWLFSTDIVRWAGTLVVILLLFLLSIVYFGKETVILKIIKRIIETVKPTVVSVFMFIYAFLPYSPYN